MFGHLEYVLKRNSFKHLREEPDNKSSLCPLNPESIELICELVDQTISILGRENIEFLHVGADEVKNIGSCPDC